MALISDEYIEQFRTLATSFLADGSRFTDGKPRKCEDIQQGATAWEIAHRVGIVRICYEEIPACCDAHIKTALAKIFPNAVFADTYRH
jgi:hypothetical protein